MTRAIGEHLVAAAAPTLPPFDGMTGHVLVARALRECGASVVCGVPGVPVYGTFGACARERLRLIGTRHQQSAVLMAAAHNYLAGDVRAVALVSSGPAASNALTGAVVAHANGWPVIVIAGAVPRMPRHYGYFTEVDACALYRPVTKACLAPSRTADIPRVIAQAFELCMQGRPGPVLVDLPGDLLDDLALAGSSAPAPPAVPGCSPDLVARAARVLAQAQRPLLILGEAARWNDAYLEAAHLVEETGIPFATSPMGRGLLAEDHRCCINAATWHALAQADVVLMVGARLDWTFRHGTPLSANARVVQVDIDAGELGRNRPEGDVLVHGDPAAFVRELRKGGAVVAPDGEWLRYLRTRCDEIRRGHAEGIDAGQDVITPRQLASALQRTLPRDALTVLDGNLVLAECQLRIPVRTPLSRLTPGGSGCLGIGIPFAIGAKLAEPTRAVVAVCGDFAFGLGAMELETAVRHRVPIVVVVGNNDGSAGILRHREMFPDSEPEPVSMYTPGLRYDDVMRMCGGHAEHVSRVEALDAALVRALVAGRPACVHVELDREAQFPRG